METNYYLMIGVISGIAVLLFLIFYFFKKKYPPEKETFKAKLLYFDEDGWFCSVDFGTYEGRGFICVPEEGHFVGEEIEVEIEGTEIYHNFKPVENK